MLSRLDSLSETINHYAEHHLRLGESKPYFAAFGVATAALLGISASYHLAKGFVSYCLAGPLALGVNVRDFGEWAVVTGANAGIGKTYCLELARRGLNIVLIARNQEDLNATARDIELTHRVQTKVIVADFSGTSTEMYSNIQQELTGMRIAVLVNNVGEGCNSELFLENPPDSQKCLDMINVNATSYVMTTRLVLPGMLTRRKGIIVFISSVNGDIPTPKAALYSGTKAFDRFFACALAEEYKSKGILVQCVMPGAVETKMVQGEHRDSFWCVGPATFVPNAINQLGVRTSTYGHWKHAVHMKLRKSVPGMQWLV